MIINAYDTTVGKQFKASDKVENTIKTLALTRSLTPTKKEGVFVITNATELGIPVFAFPLSFEGFNRKKITVYDERPFRNDKNQPLQPNEIVIQRLAAFLQQDVFEGNISPLKSCRLMATKAFSESVSSRLGRGLDMNETMTLKILLVHYFVSIQESNVADLELLVSNVCREIYGSEKGYINGVVEGLEKPNNLSDLVKLIHENPTLYKLKTIGLKELLASISGISFAALKGKIITSAAEAPCFFTAMVYGAARFKAYSKTPLGEALDPKYNKNILESFTRTIDYTYDLTE